MFFVFFVCFLFLKLLIYEYTCNKIPSWKLKKDSLSLFFFLFPPPSRMLRARLLAARLPRWQPPSPRRLPIQRVFINTGTGAHAELQANKTSAPAGAADSNVRTAAASSAATATASAVHVPAAAAAAAQHAAGIDGMKYAMAAVFVAVAYLGYQLHELKQLVLQTQKTDLAGIQSKIASAKISTSFGEEGKLDWAKKCVAAAFQRPVTDEPCEVSCSHPFSLLCVSCCLKIQHNRPLQRVKP